MAYVSGTKLFATTATTTTAFYDAATTPLASAELAAAAIEFWLPSAPPCPTGPSVCQNGAYRASKSSYGFLYAPWCTVSPMASSLLLPTFGCTTTKATAVAASTATPFSTTTAAANGQQQFALWGF